MKKSLEAQVAEAKLLGNFDDEGPDCVRCQFHYLKADEGRLHACALDQRSFNTGDLNKQRFYCLKFKRLKTGNFGCVRAYDKGGKLYCLENVPKSTRKIIEAHYAKNI